MPLSAQAAANNPADMNRLVRIDPRPLFSISPLLQLQFMESLGATDSSVKAAWDRESDRWREDFLLRAGSPVAGYSPSHPRIRAPPSAKTIRKCSRGWKASSSALAGGFPRARPASSSLSFAGVNERVRFQVADRDRIAEGGETLLSHARAADSCRTLLR